MRVIVVLALFVAFLHRKSASSSEMGYSNIRGSGDSKAIFGGRSAGDAILREWRTLSDHMSGDFTCPTNLLKHLLRMNQLLLELCDLGPNVPREFRLNCDSATDNLMERSLMGFEKALSAEIAKDSRRKSDKRSTEAADPEATLQLCKLFTTNCAISRNRRYESTEDSISGLLSRKTQLLDQFLCSIPLIERLCDANRAISCGVTMEDYKVAKRLIDTYSRRK